MTITDLDIYRSAKLLIDQYGDAAMLEASIKADEMVNRGDVEGRNVWLRILQAIKFLQDESTSGPFH